MREIKFRAWNIEEKIMCYDNEDDSACYWDGVVASNVGLINSHLKRYEGHKETYEYMQYTGQKDKNGNEIYEGDIVDCKIFGQKERGVLKYSDMLGAYFLTGISRSDTELWASGERLIVGNIYEHPHLLESEDGL